MMPAVKPNPTYNAWVSIPKNYGVPLDDSKPCNIPYFDEKTFDQSPQFIEGLNDNLSHRLNLKEEEEVEDEVFYEMVERLQEIVGVTGTDGMHFRFKD
jgi:hypothetical protein